MPITRILRFAAVLCVITALTGMATHYARRDWSFLLNAAVLVEMAVNASFAWIARRDPFMASRIAIATAISVIPDFEIWEQTGSPFAPPVIALFFSVMLFVALWPLRAQGAAKEKSSNGV